VPTLHQALATNPSALEEVRALLGASSEDLQLALTACLAELRTHLSSAVEAVATMGPSRCVRYQFVVFALVTCVTVTHCPICWASMMPAGSLLKHADVRVLWHTYCGSRDRVDTDTFLDAVRHHLAADTTVDPAAALGLLSGDNRTALASALDADSSGQVRARTMGTARSVATRKSLERGNSNLSPSTAGLVCHWGCCATWLSCRCPSRK
jgi:hypothetical protein